MSIPCVQCAAALAPGAAFCGQCGAAQPTPKPLPPLDLAIDLATIRHFQAGTRCLLRFRVDNRSARSSLRLSLRCALRGAGELPLASAPALAPGGAALLTAFFVPTLGGFDELQGALVAELEGGASQRFRFEGFQLRIGAGGAPQVQVVNIDQRSARVVDNSRSSFGLGPGPAGGVLLEEDGDWHPLPLALEAPIEGEREGDAAPAPEIAATPAIVDFVVTTEKGDYHLTSTLARGDLATVYAGVHRSTAAPVALKLADDPADNDLIQSEVRVLSLLTSAPSPQ